MILHFNRCIYEKYVYHAGLCLAYVEGRAVYKKNINCEILQMLYKNCSHVSKVSRKLNESKELRVQIFKSQYKQQKIVLNTVFRTCGLMFIFMHFIHRSFQANSHLQNNSPHSSIPSQRVTLHQTTAEPETNLYDLGTTISLHLGKKKKKQKTRKKSANVNKQKPFLSCKSSEPRGGALPT